MISSFQTGGAGKSELLILSLSLQLSHLHVSVCPGGVICGNEDERVFVFFSGEEKKS